MMRYGEMLRQKKNETTYQSATPRGPPEQQGHDQAHLSYAGHEQLGSAIKLDFDSFGTQRSNSEIINIIYEVLP